MTLKTLDIPSLDPFLYTGMQRLLAGPCRTGSITVDVPYGTSGKPEFARWVYVGGTGNLSYVKWDGTTQVLNNIIAGIWHPIYSIMVNSSGTSATGLVWGS